MWVVHFYFDNMELVVLENESLLRRKFCGGLREKSRCLKKVVDTAG